MTFCDIIIHASNRVHDLADLCKGSTADSDSVCLGSNPRSAAKAQRTPSGVRFFCALAADLSLRTLLRALALGIGFGFPAQSATSLLDRVKRGNFRASREYPSQKKDQLTCELVFFQRCLPLRASDVDFVSDVHCVSDVSPYGEAGKHHITLRRMSNTSLWRSHNTTAATPQHHSQSSAPIPRKRLAIFSILCYTNRRKAVGI